MTPDNRTHAITFRLGTREYEQLMKTVSTRGARSLSEFTRTAVLSSLVTDTVDEFVKQELQTLIETLDAFDAKLRELRRQLHQVAIRAGGAHFS